MADSKIEWTDKVWNPIRGCSRVSPGCQRCYAERQAHRFSGPGQAYEGLTKLTSHGPVWTGKIKLVSKALEEPLRWRKPARIFVNSMSDLFHEDVPDEFIAMVWQTMGVTPQHTYQILTKRPDRMRSWVSRWYAGHIVEPLDIRPVPGFPGYFVTTRGEVLGKRSDTINGLAQNVGQQGHRRVTMHCEGSPNSGDRQLVHRLVLTAFARAPHPGEQACHRNGNPSDNRLSNLYWGTQSDNWRDRSRHGNRRSYAKLTKTDVDAIRKRAAVGETASDIARDFPVSDTQIRNIVRGIQWTPEQSADLVVPPSRAQLDCVWLGVSCEDQERLTERAAYLAETPAAIRFLSLEPLLGRVDLCETLGIEHTGAKPGIDWVIVGGESGPKARPFHLEWARVIVRQCKAAEVPCFVKQLGSAPVFGPGPYTARLQRHNKWGDPAKWPEDLRVREMPA